MLETLIALGARLLVVVEKEKSESPENLLLPRPRIAPSLISMV
jgi:hypothetical protein